MKLDESYGADDEASPVLVGEQPYVLAHVLSDLLVNPLVSFPTMKFGERVGAHLLNGYHNGR